MAYLWSLLISVSALCCECRLKGQIVLNTLVPPPGLVPRPLLRWEAVIYPPTALGGGGGLLMFAFILSEVFRINGKWSNLIFPLKNFPNLCDPCYILPHLLPKRFRDCLCYTVTAVRQLNI